MTTPRRGFTLVELLVAMVMLAVVGAAMYALLINTQRLSRRQVERSDLQDDVRAGTLILPAELREIGYDGPNQTDLLQINASSVRFRAMRGVGITCGLTATQLYILKPIYGDPERSPKISDTLLVFIDHDQNQAADDEWVKKAITAIDAASNCPSTGQPAIKLTVGGGPGDLTNYVVNVLGPQIFAGGPVRFYEVMEVGLYTADSKSWLGAKSLSLNESYQPVLGPLDPDNGVVFTYLNATGGTTADRNLVRSIQIDFHGRSDEPIWTGRNSSGPTLDTLSLTARVALRNNSRP